jgi:hypothetical protein
MLLGAKKNSNKCDSTRFSSQGGGKSFISPSTLKIEKMNHHLFKTVLEDSNTESDDAESISSPCTTGTALNTPSCHTIGTAINTPKRDERTHQVGSAGEFHQIIERNQPQR